METTGTEQEGDGCPFKQWARRSDTAERGPGPNDLGSDPENPYDWEKIARRESQWWPEGRWRVWLILAGRGFGKLFYPMTEILTMNRGWITFAEITVGDVVFDEQGRPCNVTGVYEPPLEQIGKTYRLTFSDGVTLDTCADHQWVTWTHADRKAFNRSSYEPRPVPKDWPNWRLSRMTGGPLLPRDEVETALSIYAETGSIREAVRRMGRSRQALTKHLQAGRYVPMEPKIYPDAPGPRIRTTAEIIATFRHGKRRDLNHSIPLAGPLQYPETALPVDPYLFGYWLGDGHSATATFTCATEDQPHLEAAIRAAGYRLGQMADPISLSAIGAGPRRGPGTGRFRPDPTSLTSQLKALGALGSKTIPVIYLYASAEQRLALLQGLMDSDGYASASHVEFCTTRKDHAEAVVWLARSLGQKPRLYAGRATYEGKDYGEKYRVSWKPTIDVFRLPRKREAIVMGGAQDVRNYHRMITAYEEITPMAGMRCIEVDSPNHMYLVGCALIPTHNTRTGSETVGMVARKGVVPRIALVGETEADAREVMVEGPDGILKRSRPGFEPVYEPSKRRLTWPNGVVATTFSGADPDQLRGPQHGFAWVDELAKFAYPVETWDNLMLGLRMGVEPCCLVTTTPRPIPILRTLLRREGADVAVTRGTTYDNAANLPRIFLEEIVQRYEGTTVGRQELYAEMIDEAPGALWTRKLIEAGRREKAPALARIVVAVDPSVARTGGRDACGIVVAGIDDRNPAHGWILEDATLHAPPFKWAQEAARLYEKYRANTVIAEDNQGGGLVRQVLEASAYWLNVKLVHASHGKVARAEPISALYERGIVHHVGGFAALEDEMTTWLPGRPSPNRMDALVYALTELMLNTPSIIHAEVF